MIFTAALTTISNQQLINTHSFAVSAVLMQLFGWMIADPVCSIFIAVLIGLSVGSLVADSMAVLMQRSPKELDHSLPEAYQKVMQLEGVQGVHETHFWTLCSNYYCGGRLIMIIIVMLDIDISYFDLFLLIYVVQV